MKMNWGKGIVLGMSAFILFIASLAGYMLTQPDDYDKQYYEKGLAFDKDYAKEKQVNTDKAKPVVRIAGNQLEATFVKAASGTVKFLRPSDRRLDQSFSLKTDANDVVTFPVAKFTTGQWQLVFEWTSGGKQYLYKQEVFIP
ncbi:FixH family protein [Mucilaginibacter sp. RS28]|uniref:FixH family protein n=1 Tax=Mucilaginibacter straminoryzae TaxID=2932774 RepID=A0A9X1X0G1_9SPHI|nr:FixH family protein [Mucilaginibacter straminoryzae]MCJ8208962.1 FixH family protein [Mucilaginibacter straminoryzae]